MLRAKGLRRSGRKRRAPDYYVPGTSNTGRHRVKMGGAESAAKFTLALHWSGCNPSGMSLEFAADNQFIKQTNPADMDCEIALVKRGAGRLGFGSYNLLKRVELWTPNAGNAQLVRQGQVEVEPERQYTLGQTASKYVKTAASLIAAPVGALVGSGVGAAQMGSMGFGGTMKSLAIEKEGDKELSTGMKVAINAPLTPVTVPLAAAAGAAAGAGGAVAGLFAGVTAPYMLLQGDKPFSPNDTAFFTPESVTKLNEEVAKRKTRIEAEKAAEKQMKKDEAAAEKVRKASEKAAKEAERARVRDAEKAATLAEKARKKGDSNEVITSAPIVEPDVSSTPVAPAEASQRTRSSPTRSADPPLRADVKATLIISPLKFAPWGNQARSLTVEGVFENTTLASPSLMDKAVKLLNSTSSGFRVTNATLIVNDAALTQHKKLMQQCEKNNSCVLFLPKD